MHISKNFTKQYFTLIDAARCILNKNKKYQKFPEFLYGKNDLKSIEEFVKFHGENVRKKKDVKGMFTSDPLTINIAKEVLKISGDPKEHELNFFEKKIFSQPSHSSNEAGSVLVKISDIRDFPNYEQQYEVSKDKNVMLCVGGPAAEDQVVLASIITKIREKLHNIIYATRDYKESNVNHSAKQSHARHGNALNADKNLTGHALLPTLIARSFFGTTLEEALEPDYRKIDVKFTLSLKKLRIYFGNELNWLKQEYKKFRKSLTEHDVNRLESILSQEIMNVVENQADVKISGGAQRAVNDSSYGKA